MDALLSIKPEFARKILTGEKRYEFRRTTFRDPSLVDRVFMYSSSPQKEIVGLFTISGIVEDQPETLWQRFNHSSGISRRERFLDYFAGAETGYAIGIEDQRELTEPIDPRAYFEDFRPPICFKYLEDSIEPVQTGDREPC